MNREIEASNIIKQNISDITVIVPSLDEKGNIFSLRDTLQWQRRNLSPNVDLHLVISDNGSSDETLRIYKQITEEQEVQPETSTLNIAIVSGSRKGFNGSARHEGVKAAVKSYHERNPQTSPNNHLLVSLDADTIFEHGDILQTLSGDIFTDPNIMVGYGPIKFKSSSGKISKDYQTLQRPFTKVLLAYLFRLNNRHIGDYLNGPREVFHTIFTAMREKALTDDGGNICINYKPTDRAGVDVRMSLLLQRHLQESQIVYDKRLSVLTSARGYETKNGDISRLKFAKKTLELFLSTHYVPYALQRELEKLPDDEKASIAKKLRFADVIGSFVRDVDHEIYGLEDSEHLIGIIDFKMVQRMQQNESRVLPAKNLKTGEIIPKKFAVIGSNKTMTSSVRENKIGN